MEIKIDPKLKPLYANLLKLEIGKYLMSECFNRLCIEINVDDLWSQCERYVLEHSSAGVISPDYTKYIRDVEKAFGIFLTELFKSGKEKFIEVLNKILVVFADWSEEEKDFSKVINSLLKLGYTQEELKAVSEIGKFDRKVDFQKVDRLKTEREYVDEKLCFVLMPFDKRFNSVYEAIKEIVEDFGLECKRADEIFSTRAVIEDIWEYIQKARILIADLTGRNPNVFYELGFAHGKGKKVILLTQSIEDVPFDVRHLRCIVYEDSISGANESKKKLRNTLKEELVEK